MDNSRTLTATPARLTLLLTSLLISFCASAQPRVIALEYSFVDALSLINISPVGIADDGKAENLLPALRRRIAPWQSVGNRAQPSLEAIVKLKPDLIIADQARHASVLPALERIAPTLLLPSRGSTYQQVLETAQVIGDKLGKGAQMTARLNDHKQYIAGLNQRLQQNDKTILFAVVSDQGIWLHSPNSFAGSLMQTLGLRSPLNENTQPYQPGNFELLLKLNPDWLLTGAYGKHTLLDDWQQLSLFNRLTAAQQHQLTQVSPKLWSTGRGVLAAELMAARLNQLLGPPQTSSLAGIEHAL